MKNLEDIKSSFAEGETKPGSPADPVSLKPSHDVIERSSAADRLLELAQAECSFFSNSQDTAFAEYTNPAGTREIWAVDSDGFKKVLSILYWRNYRKACKDDTFKDVRNTLTAIAQYEGETHPVI